MKFNQILCPTDLSPGSDAALSYAAALAHAYGSKLVLLHCVAPGNGAGHPGARGLFEESIAEYVPRAVSDGLDWEGITVETDDPGAAIADAAAERHADLVVMRSRRRPLRATLLGSTAESVCRIAPCPVLVTHPGEREFVDPRAGTLAPKRVLVAYDFSDDAELALRYGTLLAGRFGAGLELLHVLNDAPAEPPEGPWGAMSSEGAYYAAARRLQTALLGGDPIHGQVEPVVRWGRPYQEILQHARERSVDLICMGARGANFGMRSLFGSNVDRVLRQAPCPILITRPLRPAFTGGPQPGIVDAGRSNYWPSSVARP
jgi:nucleotide-binding universal stress UspA family protein